MLSHIAKRVFASILLIVIVIVSLIAALSAYTYVIIEREDAEAAAPLETVFVTVGDERIATRSWPGTGGSTVVLVGGLSAWGGTWERTVREQRERGSTHTFIAIDLPPFGYSIPSAPADYTRTAQAARINGVVDALNLENVIFVGHSYGGGPVAEAALTRKDGISRVILISPVLNIGAPSREAPTGLISSETLRETLVAAITQVKPLLLNRLSSFVYVKDNISYELLGVYTKPFNVEGTSRKLSDWIYTYLADDVSKNSSTKIEAYESAPYPITLLWGEEDSLTPISESEPLITVGVSLVAMPNMGHIPMIEDIERFNDLLALELTDIEMQ